MKKDELKVQEYFHLCNLRIERFNKEDMQAQTPDFKVYRGDELVFYCEVKSLLDDDFEGLRPDPIYNKVQNRVYESINQFLSVNKNHQIPNVLVFINHNFGCDERDLIFILSGNFYASSGKIYPIFKKFSEGRIKENKDIIDLYIWFQEENEPIFLYKDAESPNKEKLKSLFTN